MAKKKNSASKEKDWLPRKASMSMAELGSDLDEIETTIGELRTLAGEVGKLRLDSLPIDGVQKLPRAKVLLQEFAANMSHSIRRANIRS